ncbi:hypothetical protein MBRA1_003346 [Malassezia brasiliensis]|uniref:Transcription factor TFIIIC triple barrel domain-containing protein n=1 Tax=Malassezia brasiliensis TaxID=1821822 RepID=A0AAF0DWB0_9BASI|nr:hypothetical protein MBRA1_003346 [Malassezia brasiliensis]
MAGGTPLDASWERVETLDAPEGEGWELVEESDELVVLDLADAAHAAKMDVNMQPGTEIVVTGLETETPLLKVDGIVMKGTWDELFGSAIVLEEHTNDANEPTSDDTSHTRLHPVPPADHATAPATGASSTTSRRIAFVPTREVDEPLDELEVAAHKPHASPEPMHEDEETD